MQFDDYLQQLSANTLSQLHSSWGQGRTSFGGMSAGLLVAKMQLEVEPEKQLRSLNVNFSGPLLCEHDFSLESETLSSGKGTSQLSARCIQDDKTVTLATAVFGKARFTNINTNDTKADMPKAGSGQRLGYIKGLTPEFVQHIEFSYEKGQFPFTNSPLNELEGWMRFKQPVKEFSLAHIILLIDAWPPTALQKLKKPTACSTISWNLDFAQPMPKLNGDSWLHYHAKIVQSGEGYVMTEAQIRAQDGQLIALSRQLIGLYEKE